jgi:hypothetical protein
MSSKLILTVTIAVTSEEPIDSKFYVDPAAVEASDVILVECPFNIDAKALDISKVIQGTLPGVIEEHKERRYAERERLRALTQPSLLTMMQEVAEEAADEYLAATGNEGEEPESVPQATDAE